MTSRHPQPVRQFARAATTVPRMLAEGPVWDAERALLIWVDILAGHVLIGRLCADGTIEERECLTFADTVGAVALAPRGGLLVALSDRVVERSADGTISEIARLIGGDEGRRLNDGKPDPAGRFLVGTLSHGSGSHQERLVRLERDGGVRVIDDDLTLSNGLAWSVDGTIFYSVDTLTRRIHRRPYDVSTGAFGGRGVLVELPLGYPDGICVDAEDHIWAAVWGRGEVHRYTPNGELVAVVEVSAPHVSSVAFAGPLLDTLVITTAREDLSDPELRTFPDSGCLFTTRPGVSGLPAVAWSGSIRQEGENS